MVNSASPSTFPYLTPDSSPDSAQANKRKPRAPYKIAKRRPRGDLRPVQGSGEHEDDYAHRLCAWCQRGAVKRKGDGKLKWRGEDVYVEEAIRILNEEARQRAEQSRALPGGLQGFNGGPPMPLLQPSGPLPAQPFGAPMPLLQPPEPLPAQQPGGFMPPTMQQQATMPNYEERLQRLLRGDFLNQPQGPFPQPALAQQADYLDGPFMSLEDQQRLGVLDPEPAPAPAPVQQAEDLSAQESGGLSTSPTDLPADIDQAYQKIWDKFMQDPYDSSNDEALGIDFDKISG
ncbi:hypothetical protein G6514_010177 [Epicoccum nigrum]|nr:hypothetical protein G6514_010177 [Epicoccum nigrum]